MKYAVIGLGFIYPRHKKAIEETGGQIVQWCDSDVQKLPRHWARKGGIFSFEDKICCFTNWLEMMDSERFKEVDTVIICTPNYLHAEMSVEAMKRGKKVICEKPLCINPSYFKFLKGIQPVLQLRYHPKLKNLKTNNVQVTAKMFRDDQYWNGWKGDKTKSGGILYNLGIHYIDLLILLLGDPKEIISFQNTDKLVTGKVNFEKGVGEFHIEVLNNKNSQTRNILVDGQEIGLSDKDNLSYEDLHKEVYKDFIKGEGVSLAEAKKSLQLVHDLLKFSER